MIRKAALLLVDVQNDFCPGGSLPVPGGNEIVPLANELQGRFDLVLATKDWHPKDHSSFASNHPGRKPGERVKLPDGSDQILWPDHCVQGTRGAEFVSGFDTRRVEKVFFKGVDREMDSYSGFFDNRHRRSTGLADHLRGQAVEEVVIAGLATDYCVKFTALDARGLGLKTTVVLDACRAVNLAPGDGDRAVEEMKRAGARVVQIQELLAPRR